MFKMPVKKEWFKCPYCGKNAVLHDNTAKCRGVYMRCKKCGKEIEIKIN